MKFSIIIPTYNEEEYLPLLLESIKKQKFKDYEIIVADANSQDNTVKIAKDYNCILVEGGMPGVGRNNGARIAKGEILLFLDSDLKLTKNYLQELIEEFEEKKLDLGITQINPLSEKKRDKILHDLANWFMIAFEKIKPHGAGCYGIVAKKHLHDYHDGFDESLNFGEDTDYIERLAKKNNFKVLRNPKVFVSTRRLEEEGLVKLAMQYGKSTLNDFRGIRTNAEDLEYGFGHGLADSFEKEEFSEKKNVSKTISIANDEELFSNKLNLKESNSSEISTSKNKRKRIFYSICGEGMGHAVRSGVILEELIKKHEVYIFSNDRAYEYLNSKFDNVFEIGGFNTVYEDNKVKNKKTLINAIKLTPNNLKENYEILYKKAKEIKPNIIISDFENYSSILSILINVPLISVDNIHMITQTKIDYPPKHHQDMLKAKGVIKSYIMTAKKYILTSFFYPKLKNPNKAVIYPPVIRKKIKNLKTSYEDYILVYQTSESNLKLIETLKEVDEKFIIYGFNKEKIDGNLTFRKFNEDKIYEDMKNAKAVITNGGFTLISEAIYLKKPIYTIPTIGNFEQLINAFYVDKLSYGEMHKTIKKSTLKSFLSKLKKYQKTLYNTETKDNQGIIEELEKSIEMFSKEY
ncbi:MAG: glycosyltransferase [Methanobrevibacter sp.]|nr:glycosyltransferase [Methanobrevibacter sp.]